MADKHLREILNKYPSSKDVKTVVSTLFDRILEKTLSYVKEKYQTRIKKPLKKSQKAIKASPHTKVLVTSQAREENANEQKHKEIETKEFIKKLKKEQKERENRQKEKEEEERIKKIEEAKQLEKQKQEFILRQEQEKLRRVNELKIKSQKRKQEISQLIELGNQEYKKVLSSKPLHEKIEEKYFSKVLMPELERHKLELAKKREMLQPINRSEILEHARKHDQLMEEHDMQKRNVSQESNYDPSKLRSKFTLAYLEDQRKRKQQQEKESLGKKNLIEKQKQYAELILEMYQPTIDPAKQLELQLIKEKLRNTSVKIIKKRSAKSLSAKEGQSDGENPLPRKKKWKKNLMIPEAPKKRESKKVDWLQEQRKHREVQHSAENLETVKWDESLTEEKMKLKVKLLEKEVRKQEIKLEVSNPTNIKGIEATEHVGNMLINTIKGKLAILEKN